MEELLPVISDDLVWHDSGHKTRTPADYTRYVGWEGKWYRVDLTEDHMLELATFVKRYADAGKLVDDVPPRKAPSRSGKTSGAYQRNQEILAFAKAHGLRYTERARGKGSPYFPVATLRAYEAFEAAKEYEAVSSSSSHGG